MYLKRVNESKKRIETHVEKDVRKAKFYFENADTYLCLSDLEREIEKLNFSKRKIASMDLMGFP